MELHERWFDDWRAGEVIETGESYRLDATAIVEFGREYDPQLFHTDPVAAKQSMYGGLIASGWQTGAVMMRLLTGMLGESSMGSPGVDELRWVAPVRPGDELRIRLTVERVVPSSSKPDRGIVYSTIEVLNQRNEVVMTLRPRLMLRRDPARAM